MLESPITNCWGQVPATRLAVDHRLVYQGRPGLGYSHQSQLHTHAGRLYASWTLGVRDEEGPGEDMVFAMSDDRGETWTPPRVIISAQPGRAAKTIVVSSGLRTVGDLLIAYAGHWDRSALGTQPDGFRTHTNDPARDIFCDVRTEASVSRDDGATWSTPVTIVPDLTNYMTPFTTASGRVILPGNLTCPWTDDPTGLTDWNWSGVPGLHPGLMDNYFNMIELNDLARTGQKYNEACVYQLADGTLRMMLRNEMAGANRLGVSESRDDGLSWSTPVLTDYSDTVCRAHFGRLPDGRYFGMNCPVMPPVGKSHGHRTPAVLALSDDGTVFDRHFILGDEPELHGRFPGLYKHGRYGYPYLHVDGEYGYMIYSTNKEDIGVGRFHLADLR